MGTLLQDLRVTLRGLKKSRAFSFIVVLSIALAIGANTTIFTWMESLILNPYPLVADADRLVALNTTNPAGGGGGAPPISWPEYLDWREKATSFEGMVVFRPARFNLRNRDQQIGEPVWGQMVSGNYFDVLKVPTALGRAFLPTEEKNATPVAVISHNLWQRRFAGDQAIIGRRMMLNNAEITIVGVTAPRFAGTVVGLGFDLWIPAPLQPLVNSEPNRLLNRGDRWLQGFARLKPGVTLAQARTEMEMLARQISAANGEVPPVGAAVRLMREQFLGSVLFALFSALLVITGLVLLTACANVANLLLARAVSRQKEIGIKLALGAGRWRLVRQLLTESLSLAALGGIAGLLLAHWSSGLLKVFIPAVPQPVALEVGLNLRVVGFALLLTLLTALIFGLVPALRATRPDLVSVLKNESYGFSSGRSKLRSVLVITQVAFSLISLVCAGLFLRSLQRAQAMDLGFSDPGKVLLVSTDLNLTGLDEANGLAVTDRLLERVRVLPGVSRAAFSTMVPLGFGGHSFSGTTIEGYTPGPNERISTERIIISPDYFETMGIPLVEGRSITAVDRREGLRVAVVNEAFVRRYWPGQNPIGKRLDQGPGWATVVGVAKDSKYNNLGETPHPVVYSTLSQRYASAITLYLRTVNEPKILTEVVRREFAAANASLPFLDPRTLAEHISASRFVQFIGASMLSGFGALALLLSAVGIYGLLSWIVTQRQRELAIRMALGATTGNVLRVVLGQGLRLTLIGLIIGAGIAFGAGQLLRSQLLDLSPSDPLTFVITIVLLAGVAMLACYIPAWRATKVDPIIALRCQ
ncbi:MAG: ABC transporter permease [Acidobacteria bacterium]|nr:ABC transporter permease [Acidobacteriota bacterium]